MSEAALFDGALVKSVSVAHLLQQRDAILQRVAQAVELFEEAEKLALAARITDAVRYRHFDYILLGDNQHHRSTTMLDKDGMTLVRKRLDSLGWQVLMSETGLRSLMDATARKEWDTKIHNADTPPLTLENITATFGAMHGARQDMFERGVIAAFKRLSWNYKTNRPFKFGKRIIITFLSQYGSFRYERVDELADLQRVFCILDGKPEEDHRNGLQLRLQNARRGEFGTKTRGEHDDQYMHVRWFKNQNGHITFKRPDLVEHCNRIIAKHFPGALAFDPHTE